MFKLIKNSKSKQIHKIRFAIYNNSIVMVIDPKKHQNNNLYISKCKQKEAHFVDFYTT